ncbi:pyridine nucleotide-disulfide oxidoreductase [Pseudidiomarina salinarum]|uniref:Pyridine nucleotide-disulfide oxidoreductase n=1 Tax=Pseudidiomarina salinarum TaxID=435908 RepID=A0A094JHB0_9GAMM|nr:bifunctional TVP38/TMEM64 family protein/FAD-dependent oxidoreductase [Pseudidiomarina salinarum]KFZ31941.1 pyridine nucleotide-disulfide oxidoreductase [Pseudidiomarina salinarum]RUO70282.1 pyridine nucleotide-disulfide oxidoreductase [Pseudidiomarina salinarum]
MKKTTGSSTKLIIVAVIAALVAVIFGFDLHQYLELDKLKEHQQTLAEWKETHWLMLFAGYFVAYVIVTALSVPGAAVMTLGAGALFGLWWGLLLASFASTFGATLAFLSARYVLRDWIEERFSKRLKAINKGIDRDGKYYLLTLRLVPVFPFWIINLVMGLTRIRLWTYYWVSQVGMLLGTAVYVNAGTQLAQVDKLGDIFSLELIISFGLLAIFPLIAKWLVNFIKQRKLVSHWQKPKKFDDNLLVIGAGSGGLVSAYIAAAIKAKVTLVEQNEMGGDCLNTGCVPSKSLLHIAHGRHEALRLNEQGVSVTADGVDFGAVMKSVHQVIKDIAPHDSPERYESLGVNVEIGRAQLVSPWKVEITAGDGSKTTRTARNIVLATGARPFIPPIDGLEDTSYLTTETIWSLTELPKKFVVMGGGPVGAELAQAFARLGSEVTIVEAQSQLLPKEDPDVADLVRSQFEADGIKLMLGWKAVAVEQDDDGKPRLRIENSDEEQQLLDYDQLLVAVGRKANLEGYGLSDIGVEVNNTVRTNDFLQTSSPSIYAVGDVAGPYQFTHTASHQAWYAAVNALFDPFKKFKVDYKVIPWATFTDPEVATVGLTEQEAKHQDINYDLTTYDISDLDRAIADQQAKGLVKVLTKPGSDKILGATLVGHHAADMVGEFILAMKHDLGLKKIMGTIHIYPTMSEANKYVAGNWRRANQPERLLKWLERFHRWRRG